MRIIRVAYMIEQRTKKTLRNTALVANNGSESALNMKVNVHGHQTVFAAVLLYYSKEL